MIHCLNVYRDAMSILITTEDVQSFELFMKGVVQDLAEDNAIIMSKHSTCNIAYLMPTKSSIVRHETSNRLILCWLKMNKWFQTSDAYLGVFMEFVVHCL